MTSNTFSTDDLGCLRCNLEWATSGHAVWCVCGPTVLDWLRGDITTAELDYELSGPEYLRSLRMLMHYRASDAWDDLFTEP